MWKNRGLESKRSSPDSHSLLSVGAVFWDASTHRKWWGLLDSTTSFWVTWLGVVLLGDVAVVTMPVLTQPASINSPHLQAGRTWSPFFALSNPALSVMNTHDLQAGRAWSPFFALSNPALSGVNTHFLPPQEKPQDTVPGSSVPESCWRHLSVVLIFRQ